MFIRTNLRSTDSYNTWVTQLGGLFSYSDIYAYFDRDLSAVYSN